MNIKDILRIYERLQKRRFDFWNIYEYNPFLDGRHSFDGETLSWNPPKDIETFNFLLGLEGQNEEITNCLLARFLLMDEKLKEKAKDLRIEFVMRDGYSRDPYFFLDNLGGVSTYAPSSLSERYPVGNIFKDSFSSLGKRAERIITEKESEEFPVSHLGHRPLFCQIYDGMYHPEELESLSDSKLEKLLHLAWLYEEKRGIKPKGEKMIISI